MADVCLFGLLFVVGAVMTVVGGEALHRATGFRLWKTQAVVVALLYAGWHLALWLGDES